MLSHLLSGGLSLAARHWLGPQVARYADLKDLRIDPKNKTASVTLLPKGEGSEITLTVERYELHRDGDKTELRIAHINCSREWIRLLAIDHVVGKRFPIPAPLVALL